jgi:hypothetical protein
MAQITVKFKDGSVQTYVKPAHCLISDEEWEDALGYCWSYAENQDDNLPQCDKPSEGCYL